MKPCGCPFKINDASGYDEYGKWYRLEPGDLFKRGDTYAPLTNKENEWFVVGGNSAATIGKPMSANVRIPVYRFVRNEVTVLVADPNPVHVTKQINGILNRPRRDQ